jgi:hypothetical protein
MAAGIGASMTAQSFNSQVGNIVIQLKKALSNIQQMQLWIAANGVAGIEGLPAAGGGTQISTGDANTIVTAFTDLQAFANVYVGTETVSSGAYAPGTGYDFDQFAKQLAGGGVQV